jgi:hypothetical protein
MKLVEMSMNVGRTACKVYSGLSSFFRKEIKDPFENFAIFHQDCNILPKEPLQRLIHITIFHMPIVKR